MPYEYSINTLREQDIIILLMAKAYNTLLEKFPIPTKMVTSGSLFSLGDAVTQHVFEKKPFSWKRNIDFFLVGFGYIAPALHLWYCKLLPRVTAVFFPNVANVTRVITSMLLDQLAFAPVLLSGFFPFNQMIMDRSFNGLGKGVGVCKEKLLETLQANWKIWPLASTINFWLMPVQYQVLFANFVGLFWNMILSYITNK